MPDKMVAALKLIEQNDLMLLSIRALDDLNFLVKKTYKEIEVYTIENIQKILSILNETLDGPDFIEEKIVLLSSTCVKIVDNLTEAANKKDEIMQALYDYVPTRVPFTPYDSKFLLANEKDRNRAYDLYSKNRDIADAILESNNLEKNSVQTYSDYTSCISLEIVLILNYLVLMNACINFLTEKAKVIKTQYKNSLN